MLMSSTLLYLIIQIISIYILIFNNRFSRFETLSIVNATLPYKNMAI